VTDDLSDVTPADVRRRLRALEADLRALDVEVEMLEADVSPADVALRLGVVDAEIAVMTRG
jgi:hypothetical protein